MRATPWTLLAALLLLAGCPNWDGFGIGEGDDDDAADDDASGDDDTGDDDTGVDDDDTGDDDTGDDDDSAEQEVDGALSLQYAEVPDHVGGTSTYLTFGAHFFEEIAPGAGGGVDFAGPEAVDECAVTQYSWDDMQGGTPPELEYQSAGTLTLTGAQGTFEIEPMEHGGVLAYGLELTPGTDIDTGSTWDISGPGADYPGFDYPGGLALAGARHLTSPLVTDYFEVIGELDLEWTGGTLPHVTIEIVDWDLEDDDNIYVHCWVDNDGAFTVPSEVMDLFPADDIYLQLSQPVYEIRPAGDRWIGVGTGASVVSTGYKP